MIFQGYNSDTAKADLAARFQNANVAVFRPKPKLNLVEWADSKRQLSSVASNFGGRWRTSRFEVARGPMMATTEPGVETISCEVATQTLKTELLLNIIGYHADLDPCPILLVQPKEDAVRIFSKERLAPMIRATPCLDVMSDRVRGGSNSLSYKEFPGGFVALAYAGSATELAMRPIRIVLLDEIDKYETIKNEGDPIRIAEERTATFKGNRLKVRCCSPTWEETSRIDRAYNGEPGKPDSGSDRRRAFVECPHCSHWQTLDFFKNVHWMKSESGEHFPMTAALFCEVCGVDPITREPIEGKEWTESQRLHFCTTKGAIRWHQTRPFKCCEVEQDPVKTRAWEWDEKNQVGYATCTECGKRAVPNNHAGFHASKLFSPMATVPELAVNWLEVKDDPETKQVFYNTQLALPFQLQAMRKVESHSLAARKEKYNAQIPDGTLVITAGVDVQSGGTISEGRLEIETVAWGEGFESWSVDYHVIMGDPATLELWKQLDDYFRREWKDSHGRIRKIEAACIDTGGHSTESVYKYCAPRHTSNVWGIKGRSDMQGQWSPVWPSPAKYDPKKTRVGYRPITIGVNSAKEAIRELLLVETPGPGFQHFPHDRPDNYFEQLTSEKLLLEYKGGRAIKFWKQMKGLANEALDARVYAYAALRGLMIARKFSFAKRKDALASYSGISIAQGPEGAIRPAPVVERPRVRRGAFMS